MKLIFLFFFLSLTVLGKEKPSDSICAGARDSIFFKNIDALKLIPEVIITDQIVENLHYVNKYYKYNSKKCKADEVFVEGPLFAENGLSSAAPVDQKRKKNLVTSTEELVSSRGNSFCVDRIEFEKKRNYAQSIFQTRVASGSKNEGTSFLVGPNVVMTNYHIAAPPDKDPHNCRSLEINLNSKSGEWIPCSKVLYCNKEYDVCFVEMKKSKSGQLIGDLVNRLALSTTEIKSKNYNLIGNSYSEGIQSSRGLVLSSLESKAKDPSLKDGVVFHYVPMIGGSSGSPLINEIGQVIAINKAHHTLITETERNFVSKGPSTWNSATSMKFMKSDLLEKLEAAQPADRADLKKALDCFK